VLNLSVLLEDSARKHPGRDAVVFNGQRYPYAKIDAAANQVANLLVERGIGKGDKVALSCPNLPYFPIVYYGILKTGAVVVPLNVLLKGREVTYHLGDSEAKAYFCFQGTPELPIGEEGWKGFQDADKCEHFFLITADPAAESPLEGAETMGAAVGGQAPTFQSALTDADDGAVILYTSGTTGQPKGALLSHANLVLNALESNRMLGASPTGERHLVTLPLFHSFGSSVQMNAGFASGSTLVLIPRFEAQAAVKLLLE
jgi:long-chain acyl-CoA synthetase